MYFFFKTNRIAILLILIFFLTSIKAAKPELRVDWYIPSVVTKAQLMHYNFTGDGTGPTLFKLTIDNEGNAALNNLTIHFELTITCYFEGGESKVTYKGYTEEFSINSNNIIEILSNDLLKEANPHNIHLKKLDNKWSGSKIKQFVYSTRTVPTGNLNGSITLKENTSTIDIDSNNVLILNPNQLDLISPGMESKDDFNINIPEYTDPVLLFNWSSDLTANMYADCKKCNNKDVFILQIFKKSSGQSIDEVLSQPPVITKNLRIPSYSLFASEELEKGAVYYWRVVGLLNGVIDGTIVSSPFVFRYFRYAGIPDSYKSELKRILKNILSMGGRDDLISIVDEFDEEIHLSKEGAPLSLEYLKKLEKNMIHGNQKLTSVTVE